VPLTPIPSPRRGEGSYVSGQRFTRGALRDRGLESVTPFGGSGEWHHGFPTVRLHRFPPAPSPSREGRGAATPLFAGPSLPRQMSSAHG
jgi:hypothetical protein